MAKYSVYNGTFPCHECKVPSHSVRFYADSKDLTWMCSNKHVTRVSLQTKKTKRDYDRAERK